jgi:hypothetical protein
MNRSSIFIILPTFITTIVLMSLNACNSGTEKKVDKPEIIEASHYAIYTLEGCEYILVGVGNNRWGSHKGNCSNPIHKGQHPSPYELGSYDIEKSLLEEEKHFDCYVNSIDLDPKDGKKYWVETECGILFQSDKPYKVGDVLKNFKSEKHK